VLASELPETSLRALAVSAMSQMSAN